MHIHIPCYAFIWSTGFFLWNIFFIRELDIEAYYILIKKWIWFEEKSSKSIWFYWQKFKICNHIYDYDTLV